MSSSSKLIRYKPTQAAAGGKDMIISMVVMPVDLLEPPKFKHKRIPKSFRGSPPVTLMHSPPRPATFKDQQDWKIPPCISNWKNPKGYTIPLQNRLSASDDVRGRINHNFAKLSEAMCLAEHKAREAVSMRSRVQKEIAIKDKQNKEMILRDLARKARDECCRDRKRQLRSEAKDDPSSALVGKKRKKITTDNNRDICEKLALGMATTTEKEGEFQYDQRLFNQEKGMTSGFANDDSYNVYDNGLFTAQSTISTLYRPNKKHADSDNTCGGADDLMKTGRFKPHRAFTRASETPTPTQGHVDKLTQEADPFGLDLFLTEVTKGKMALDQLGSSGTLKATAGSMRDSYQGFQQTAF